MNTYTLSLVLIHVLLLLSSLYIYQTFFFTALLWLGLLTLLQISIIFKGNKITQILYIIGGIGTMGYELYMILTYKTYINNFTNSIELKSWLNTHYLLFVISHGIIGLITIALSCYRMILYKTKKVIIRHIL